MLSMREYGLHSYTCIFARTMCDKEGLFEPVNSFKGVVAHAYY